jgi:hypothetical protein
MGALVELADERHLFDRDTAIRQKRTRRRDLRPLLPADRTAHAGLGGLRGSQQGSGARWTSTSEEQSMPKAISTALNDTQWRGSGWVDASSLAGARVILSGEITSGSELLQP